MKEKEEILEMHYALHEERIKYYSSVYDAMDEYAKEIAIGFLDWAVDNYSVSYEGFGISYNEKGEEGYVNNINGERVYLPALFELFKKENNIK